MIRLINQYILCPVLHRPLFAIVPDGIEIKCHYCRRGEKHLIRREHLEQAWHDISTLDTRPLQAIRA